MIILDRAEDLSVPDAGEYLDFLLGGASVSTLTFLTSFVEFNDPQQEISPENQSGTSNGTTPVVILSPPSDTALTRQLKSLSIYNPNAASTTVTVRFVDDVTTRIILKTVLDLDDTLQYNDGEGFRVIDKDGNIKIITAPLPLEINKLAQSNPSAATLTDAYTVPTSTQFRGKVIVVNRSSTATSFRISLAPNGAADANSQYIAYDVPISGNNVYESSEFFIDAADVVRVYATLATLTFNITGIERV